MEINLILVTSEDGRNFASKDVEGNFFIHTQLDKKKYIERKESEEFRKKKFFRSKASEIHFFAV
jgi:hypothetical protein